MAIGKEGNVKWVDGLRGVASASVVITHICRAFDHALFSPSDGEGVPSRFLQLPMVRIWTQGRLGVAIFAFVTGYVCALKPIRLSRVGNQEAAFTSMGKSALRRVPRLILPTTVSTLIIWFLAQFGAFHIANHCNSNWLRDTVPNPSPSFTSSVVSLVRNLITTWTRGANVYEPGQWTLLPLLRCSMWIYAYMLASAYMQPRFRMMASMTMVFFFWACGDTVFGMPTFFGAFMSEVQNHGPANEWVNSHRKLGRLLATVFFVMSFYLGSLPEVNAEWTGWSRDLHALFDSLTFEGTELHRFSSCVGLIFLALSLHFAPGMRDVLSNRYFLWLGKMSFAVYLLHGFLMRTVLTWMVYGFAVPPDSQDQDGNFVPGIVDYPGHPYMFTMLVFWFPLNYVAAFFWTAHVDPWAARVTERLVARVNIPRDEKPRLPA